MYSGTKQLGGSDHICLKAAMFENPSHQIICSTGIEQAAMNVRQMDKAQAPFRDGDKLDRVSSTFENLNSPKPPHRSEPFRVSAGGKSAIRNGGYTG
jgi:hypothetical protein